MAVVSQGGPQWSAAIDVIENDRGPGGSVEGDDRADGDDRGHGVSVPVAHGSRWTSVPGPEPMTR
jgi:hypothetical protein